jgi:acetyl esterase/lipase
MSYGPLTDNVADLWLPPAGTGHTGLPLLLFIHGGFWRAAYDRRHTGPLAEALSADGFAVCTPEYRRVGQAGGGWPGTFDDIGSAIAGLPTAVAQATNRLVDAGRVILAGHSAGGHLALWAAGRPSGGPEVAVGAVVSLAGVCDLAACYRLKLGNGAAGDLMGGGPEQFPDRYAAADPVAAIPLGVRISLVHGTADDSVPWEQSRDFAERASAAGDQVSCVLLPDVGHFELIDPLSAAWPAVQAELRSAADGFPSN